MTKYKYYLKKPRGEIVKDLLFWVAIGGLAFSAIAAPNAVGGLIKQFLKHYPHKGGSAESAFRRLVKEGSVVFDRKGRQVYISLTDKGVCKAGRLQVDHLKIKKPKKWDGKWRIIMFDIRQENRIVREALRGFLKRLEFCQLQKSVWICPYNCRNEVAVLKDFFKLSDHELRLVVSGDMGDDRALRKRFDLS